MFNMFLDSESKRTYFLIKMGINRIICYRFSPPNSYIDARKYNPQELAAMINKLVNSEEYEKYLEWTKYYKYNSSYDSPDTNPFCNLCNALNAPRFVKTYTDFRKWWNK